ncbi:Septum site-determining protein MinD [Roseivivax jejudonensis]|uniref:Septum site-determining protein MinD n=1 Tax=Roseivivax jejudonensis TaxID=1529041 RepID=A0A1X6YU17_9RHOB|nr:septum site-determining protein MinD [Roseivivax jejudonensis]SLN31231.1 Septum site-determining protein MinD [Roseivivax jejudonensis]
MEQDRKAGKVIVVTSGKGGVGKTTSAAAIGAALAQRGHKTVVIDFDVGLRNLDMIMGVERRVVFDFINVIQGDAKLSQALIRDKRIETLSVLPTSQTRDKDALTKEGVESVLSELRESFDYIICDSPAGIERGAQLAMHFADEAVVVTNPEVSSVRDSDRVLGLLQAKTDRAEKGEAVKAQVLLTRHDQARIDTGEMMTVEDVLEILAVPLLGIVPESKAVLRASNLGMPVVLDEPSAASRAYEAAAARLDGEDLEVRLESDRPRGFMQRLFGRTA